MNRNSGARLLQCTEGTSIVREMPLRRHDRRPLELSPFHSVRSKPAFKVLSHFIHGGIFESGTVLTTRAFVLGKHLGTFVPDVEVIDALQSPNQTRPFWLIFISATVYDEAPFPVAGLLRGLMQ